MESRNAGRKSLWDIYLYEDNKRNSCTYDTSSRIQSEEDLHRCELVVLGLSALVFKGIETRTSCRESRNQLGARGDSEFPFRGRTCEGRKNSDYLVTQLWSQARSPRVLKGIVIRPFVFSFACVFLVHSRRSSAAEPSFSCPIEYTLSRGRINRYI